MADIRIRTAEAPDVLRLADLKSEYVRTLYRGLIPQETLREADAAQYVPQITQWLESGLYAITLLERDHQPVAFIVYNNNDADPDAGLIYEMVCDHLCIAQEKYLLLDHVMDLMQRQGRTAVHVWILRDNFRARFLVENHGFRIDGARRSIELAGQEYTIARYTRRLG